MRSESVFCISMSVGTWDTYIFVEWIDGQMDGGVVRNQARESRTDCLKKIK